MVFWSILRAAHENKQVIFDIPDMPNLFLFGMLCLISDINLVKFILDKLKNQTIITSLLYQMI